MGRVFAVLGAVGLALACGESSASTSPSGGASGAGARGSNTSSSGANGSGASGSQGIGGLAVSGGSASGGSKNGGGGGSNSAGSGAGGSGGTSSDPFPPIVTDSECQPTGGPTLEQLPQARLVRDTASINDIWSLTVFGGSLYYDETGVGIVRVTPPTQTGEPELVAQHPGKGFYTLLGVGDFLYGVESLRDLWRTSLAALPATPELWNADADVIESAIVADASNIYFSSFGGGVYKLPLASASDTAPTQLVPTVTSRNVAVWNDHVYYNDTNDTIRRVPIAGGEPQVVTGGHEFIVSDGALYSAIKDRIFRATDDPNGGQILAIGSPQFENANHELSDLRADAERIYYRENSGSLAWVKKDGSDCRIVLKQDILNGFEFPGYAVTDHYYYVIIEKKKLYEIPK